MFNRSVAYAHDWAVTGTGSVTQAGNGITTLSQTNTYGGNTLITGGTLRVTGLLPDTTSVTVEVNGNYDVRNTDTIRLLQGAGAVMLATGKTLSAGDADNTVYSGVMSGDGAFTKLGTGTQVFSGANTYTGATTINAGTLQLGTVGGTGSLADTTAVSMSNAAIFDVRVTDTIGSLAGASNARVVLAEGITLSAGGLNSNTEVAGVIAGAGSFTKLGTGTLTLSAANTYSGATTISAGTLLLTGTLWDTSAVNLINSGAVYDVRASDSIGSLAGVSGTSVILGSGVTLTSGWNNTSTTMTGVISGASAGGIVKAGSGTLTLAGANTYNGGTTINGGLIQLGADEAIPNASLLSVASGAEFYLNHHTETVYRIAGNGSIHLASTLLIGGDNSSYTIDPTIYGTGNLVKQGTGTITVIHDINLGSSALVTVEAGTLKIGNGSTTGYLGTTPVVVNSGAVLAFNRSDSYTVNNASITGNGSVTMTGGADITLNGDIAFTLAGTPAATDARVAITAAGTFTLASGSSIAAAGIDPAAGTGVINIKAAKLINQAGNALSTGTGRWLVWTTTPVDADGGDTGEQNLAYDFRQYAAPYGTTPAQTTGNGQMYSVIPDMGTATLNDNVITRQYNGNTNATAELQNLGINAFVLGNLTLINGDRVANISLDTGATATFGSKDVARAANGDVLTQGITLNGISFNTRDAVGKPVYGYRSSTGLTFVSTGTITPKELSVSAVTVANKNYDGLTTAAITSSGTPTVSGYVLIGTDANMNPIYESLNVTVGNVAFSSKNVARLGNGNVTTQSATFDVTLTDNGSSLARNYTVPVIGRTAYATISPLAMTITANADAKFVGTADPITAQGAVGYQGVTYSGIIAQDGTSGAALIAAGELTAPTVSRSNSGVNAAGTYTGVLVASGATSTNYNITYVNGDYTVVGADKLVVTLTPITVTYGNATTFTGSAAYQLPNTTVVPVNLSCTGYTCTATDPNSVVSTFTLDAPAAGNYSSTNNLKVGSYILGASAGLSISSGTANYGGAFVLTGNTLTITPKALTYAVIGADKTYDATTNVASGAVLSITNKVGSDAINVSATLDFANKNAGSNKAINLSNLVISGADAGNYSVPSAFTSTATITPKTLNGIYTADTKIYDGTTAANVTANLTNAGVIGSDVVTVSKSAAVYDTRYVSTQTENGVALITGASRIDVSGIALAGADAGNYYLQGLTSNSGGSQTIAAGITPRPVTVSMTADNKVYDGSTSATPTYGTTLIALAGNANSGLVADPYGYTESLTLTPGSAAFVSQNAANGITVTGSGTLANAIVPRDHDHDGSNVANGQTANINVTYYASNYVFVAPTATANITKRDVAVSFAGGDKVYDGNIAATVTPTFAAVSGNANSGLVGSQMLALTGTNATFANANVTYTGTTVIAKDVTVSGFSLTDGSAGGLAANYNLVTTSPVTTTAKITPLNLSSVSGLSVDNRIYDGTLTAAIGVGAAALPGVLSIDANNLKVGSATGVFASENAGVQAVTLTGLTLTGSAADNYVMASGYNTNTLTAEITKRTITSITGLSAENKTYDGTTTATPMVTQNTVFGNIVSGDILAIGSGYTANFDTKNVGSGKTVYFSGLVLGGADAGNYQLTGSTSAQATANITQREITAVSGITASDKTYDGNATATLNASNATFTGMVAGESLALSGATGVFTSPNVARDANGVVIAKNVTVGGYSLANGSGSTVGLASNYVLTSGAQASSATATINPKAITAVSGLVANNKVYDQQTATTIIGTNAVLSGVLSGETVTVTGGTGNFADPNAGNGKTVTLTNLTFADVAGANNYVFGAGTTVNALQASISKAVITGITGITGVNRNYDQSLSAALDTASTTFTGLLSGDTLNVAGYTAVFADANAGTAKSITISGLTLGGASAGNYQLGTAQTPATINAVSANVNKLTITSVSGLAASNKVYDGNTTAYLTTASLNSATIGGLLSGDSLLIDGYTASFADKNVANAKAVTLNSLTLNGLSAQNYLFDFATTTVNGGAAFTASITPKHITGITNISVASREYNGTTTATIDATGAGFNGKVGSDVLTLNTANYAASFANKDAGTHTVTITGLALSGTDAGNYVLDTSTATTTAAITPKALTISGITAAGKAYDGSDVATTNATASAPFVFNTGIGNDAFEIVAMGTFANKNVIANGGNIVNLTYRSITQQSGTTAANYTLTNQLATTATITQALLSSVSAAKEYDGNATLSNFSFIGTKNGETLTAAGLANSANVGAGNYATSITLANGTGLATNYALPTLNATSAPVSITPKTLTLSAAKVYDGSTDLSGNVSINGTVNGQVLGYSNALANTRNVTADNYIASLALADGTGANAGLASNYRLPTLNAANAPATISAKALSVNGIAVADKVYDGNTLATANLSAMTLTGLVSGDDVRITSVGAAFGSANVAVNSNNTVINQSVTLSVSVGGAAIGNYTISVPTNAMAKINPANLVITANDDAKYAGAVTTAGFKGVSISGLAPTDTLNSLSGTLLISRDSTSEQVGTYGLNATGLISTNYNITYRPGTYTILDVNQLLVHVANQTVQSGTALTYGAMPAYTISSAANALGALTVVQQGNHFTLRDVNGIVTVFDVVALNAGNSSAGVIQAGSYTLGAVNATNNKVIVLTGALDVTRKTTAASVAGAPSKVYDGSTTLSGLSLNLSGLLTNDIVTASAGAMAYDAANASSAAAYTVNNIGLQGTDAANYVLAATTLSGTGVISPKTVTVSGITAQNKDYDGTTSVTLNNTATLTGLLNGDNFQIQLSNAQFANKNVANGIAVTFNSTATALGNTVAGNYDVVLQPSTTANITPRTVSVANITATNKTYDGTVGVILTNQGTINTGVTGETITVSSTGQYLDKNVGTNKTVDITSTYSAGANTSLSNYTVVGQNEAQASITALDVHLYGATGLTKVYNGATTIPSGVAGYGALSGALANDQVNVSGMALFDSAAAGARVVTQGNVQLSGADAGNYALVWHDGSGTITKAPLVIKANNFAVIMSQNEPANFGGVSYTGLVNGEDSAVIGTGAMTVTRAGNATSPNVYANELVVAGAVSNNYNITYQKGDLTIVGYDQLLLNVNNATAVYGNAANYTLANTATAQYLKRENGVDVVHTVSAVLDNAGLVRITDNSVQAATFTIGARSPVISGAGQLVVGSYGLAAGGTTLANASAFNSNIVLNGTVTITPAALTPSLTAPTKTYDGTTALNDVVVSLGGQLSGDAVTGAASGNLNAKNVGSGRSYSVVGATIAGNDAVNYYLTTTSFTGSDATVAKRNIRVSGITAADKVYDGSASATVDTTRVLFDGLVAGENLSITTTGLFSDANASASAKTVALSSVYGGVTKDNYIITNQATTTAKITPKAVTVSGIVANNKVYDASVTAAVNLSGIQYSNGGFVVGDVLTPTVTGTFLNKNVGDGKTVNLFTTWAGNAATLANYSITNQTEASANITKADLSLSGAIGLVKTYDGTTNMVAGVTGYGALSGLITGDNVTVAGLAAYADKNAGAQAVVRGSVVLDGADAGNYNLIWTNGTGTINKAALTITASNASGFITQTPTDAGVTYSGFVQGETASTSGVLSALPTVAITGVTNASAAGTYNNALRASGAAAANYNITYSSGNYTVVPANRLLVKVADTSVNYGSAPTYQVTTAAYVADTANNGTVTLMDLTSYTTLSTANGVTTVNVTDTFGSTAIFTLVTASTSTGGTVTRSNAGLLSVGSYYFGGGNFSKTGNSFDSTPQFVGTLTVNPLGLTASTANAPTKVYDGSAVLQNLGINLGGLLGTGATQDSVLATAVGNYTSKNVGTATYNVSNILLSGQDAANYYVTNPSFAGSNGVISQKSLTVSGITAENKVYDGQTGTTASTAQMNLAGLVAGDAVQVASAAVFVDANAASGKRVNLTNAFSGADVGNYAIVNQTETTANIDKKVLTITGVTANGKTYDATTAATINTGNAYFEGLVGSESVTINANNSSGTFLSKNAAVNATVNLSLALSAGSGTTLGNYDIRPQLTTNANINQATVTLTGATGVNKDYDATTNLPVNVSGYGALGGVITVGGISDVVTLVGRPVYATANAGARSILAGSLALAGADGGNYRLNWTNGSGTIAKAQLIVTVNDDAKFYGLADTQGYNGVSYSGFVGGQNLASSDLTGNVSITRSNSATNAAGIYADVLTANGLSSSNYLINYVAGNYEVVPAGKLLVRMQNLSTNYGTTPHYVLSSARYLDSATSTIVDLTGMAAWDAAHTRLTITDPAGGQVSLSVAPQTASADVGTAGYLKVGTYSLAPNGVVGNSPNFSNTITLTGSSTVTQKLLTPRLANPVKTYDGTTQMSNPGIVLDGVISGANSDAVTAAGAGTFATWNVGTDLGYTVETVTLTGADAGNYYLLSQAFTGTNGLISKKILTLTAPTISKDYDGNTNHTTGATDLLALSNQLGVAKDSVSAANIIYTSPNVGVNGVVAVPTSKLLGATINDGNNGNNYTVSYADGLATIAPKAITIVGITAAEKPYDGTASAVTSTANTPLVFATGINGDAVNVTATGVFTDVNVISGSNTVNLTSAYTAGTNTLLSNYTITGQASTTANITPRLITAVSGTKTYDGTNAFTALTLTGLLGGETLGANGVSFTANAAAVNYLTALTLSNGSGLASNYALALNLFSIDNARVSINPKAITITGIGAADKTYDGATTTTLTVPVINTGVGSETIVVTATGAFATANVGSNTINLTSSYTAGANTLLSNYAINGQATTTANISQLNSVTWVGGPTGDWNNPANWTGGATPTLSNVANVVIPTGTVVTFGGSGAPVNLTSIGTSGSLLQTGGTLNVGDLTLHSYTQSGGTLNAGSITLDSFAKTGGTVSTTGQFGVTQQFSQTGGTLTVGGNMTVVDQTGTLLLGNTSVTGNLDLVSHGDMDLGTTSVGGNLTATANNGNITQTGPLTVGGTATFTATSGGAPADIILENPYNNFVGAVNATGGIVSLVDGTGGIVLGTIVADRLTVASTGGPITEILTGPGVVVTGSSNFTASTGTPPTPSDVLLNNPNNDFGGPVSVSGNNINITDGTGNLILNIITATGNLVVAATGTPGDVSQAPGSVVTVSGTSSITSTHGTVAVVLVVQPSANAEADYTGAVVSKEINTVTAAKAPEVFTRLTLNQMSLGVNRTLGSASENIRVELVTAFTQSNVGVVRVDVPASFQGGFTFDLPATIKQEIGNTQVRPYALKEDGTALPAWLVFDGDKLRFTANAVPPDALPFKVQVIVGGKKVIVEITELSQ
jgi:autotransporter-associated beta strand protein